MRITTPNITEIGQTVTGILHLTVFEMSATGHIGFLKNWLFEQLLRSKLPTCVDMTNYVKVGQTILEKLQFLNSQNGICSLSWIFKISKCLVSNMVGRLISINIPYFINFSQMVAEITRLMVFNHNSSCPPSWIFFKFKFLTVFRPWCHTYLTVHNFLKIGQTVVEILQFSDFKDNSHSEAGPLRNPTPYWGFYCIF